MPKPPRAAIHGARFRASEKWVPQDLPKCGDNWTLGRLFDESLRFLQSREIPFSRLAVEFLFAKHFDLKRREIYSSRSEALRSGPSLTGLFERFTVDLLALWEKKMGVSHLAERTRFCGHDLLVRPGAFVPKHETERVVEMILRIAEKASLGRNGESVGVLEIGTGVAPIPIALVKADPRISVLATELEEVPFAIAQENVRRHDVGSRIQIVRVPKPVYIPKPERQPYLVTPAEPQVEEASGAEITHDPEEVISYPARDRKRWGFDFVVSNPPYYTTREATAIDGCTASDPKAALDGGEDGLRAIRSLFRNAQDFLKPTGFLVMEIDARQEEATERLAKQYNWDRLRFFSGIRGGSVVVVATRHHQFPLESLDLPPLPRFYRDLFESSSLGTKYSQGARSYVLADLEKRKHILDEQLQAMKRGQSWRSQDSGIERQMIAVSGRIKDVLKRKPEKDADRAWESDLVGAYLETVRILEELEVRSPYLNLHYFRQFEVQFGTFTNFLTISVLREVLREWVTQFQKKRGVLEALSGPQWLVHFGGLQKNKRHLEAIDQAETLLDVAGSFLHDDVNRLGDRLNPAVLSHGRAVEFGLMRAIEDLTLWCEAADKLQGLLALIKS